MNQGFQHSTRFIVKENGNETIKSFADYHDGDEITIKDKDNKWVWDSADNFAFLHHITHWMPIPEPPKE